MRTERPRRSPRTRARRHYDPGRPDASRAGFGDTIDSALERLTALEQQAADPQSHVQSILPVALQELRISLEELQVAEEELRQQHEELAQARHMAEVERQRYQELFDFAPDGYIVTDAVAKIQEANQAAAALLAIPAQHLCGKPLIVFVEPAGHRVFRDYLTYLVQQGGVQSSEVRLRPRRGGPLDAGVTTAVVPGVRGASPTLHWLLRDISERKAAQQQTQRAEQALQASHEQLRALAIHLQTQQEEERRRIAREIHDELGQALTVLKIDVAWLLQQVDPMAARLQERLKDMSLVLDNLVGAVRRIGTELRPGILDDLGLVAAIEWQLQEVHKRTGLMHALTLPEEDIALDQARATGMFRIFQEALTNVLRHASAQKVTARLVQEPEALVLEVADDGKGITPEQLTDRGSLGLLSMRERAHLLGGEVTIQGKPCAGTKVTLRVPYEANP